MIVTTELRGESYRDSQWVDRHGWVWKWDGASEKWFGRGPAGGPWDHTVCTEDEVSDYRVFGGRGPFLKLAAN